MVPPTMFSTKVNTHSRAMRLGMSRSFPSKAVAIGSKKFSLKSSARPMIRKTTPVAKPSAPSTEANSPNCGCAAEWMSACAVLPKMIVKPAMKPVARRAARLWSRRRFPSAAALSKISLGFGALCMLD